MAIDEHKLRVLGGVYQALTEAIGRNEPDTSDLTLVRWASDYLRRVVQANQAEIEPMVTKVLALVQKTP